MFRFFLPKEEGFFDYFEEHAALIIESCKAFVQLANDCKNADEHNKRIKDLEHRADGVAHKCIDALHNTFITPVDREHIHHLIKRLDDIVDSVDSAASRVAMYEVTEFIPEAKQTADLLVRASVKVLDALKEMRNLKNTEAIGKHCIDIYQMENEADSILRHGLARLFREIKDPMLVMKWKEIMEHLEKATDRCEDVANIIQTIVIEAS